MRTVLFALLMLLSAAASARADTIYVSDEQLNVVHIIDAATLRVVGAISVGRRPRGMQVSANNRLLYVAVSDDNRIDIVDLATRRVIGHIASGPDPETFALDRTGRRLYVANENDALISTVDVASRAIVRQSRVGAEPEGTAVSPDGALVAATSETASTLHLINAATGEVIASLMVDARPRVARFTGDGHHVWVTSEIGGALNVIDVASHRIVAHLDIAAALPQEPIVQPVGIAVTRDGARAFIGLGRARRVAEIDPRNLHTVRFFPAGLRAWKIALSSDESHLYSANGLSGDVTVIDLARNAVQTTLHTGGRPWDIVVTP
jgi:PQQ-dependent catabolism-associated beta-propeller protein